MSWYRTGTDGLEEDIERGQVGGDQVKRFWMPKGESKTVVFLDDTAFRFWEHNLFLDGSWRNWFVCLKKNLSESCPLCDSGNVPYYIGFFTVIDRTGYTDRSGNKHQNEKLLFPAKIQILEKLKRHAEKRGGLTGCEFEITRGSGPKSSSVGDDFDFMEKVDVEKEFAEIDTTPFDYGSIFGVKTAEEMSSLVIKAKDASEETSSVPY